MNQKSNKVTFKFTDNKEENSKYEYISALAKEFHRPIRIETDFKRSSSGTTTVTSSSSSRSSGMTSISVNKRSIEVTSEFKEHYLTFKEDRDLTIEHKKEKDEAYLTLQSIQGLYSKYYIIAIDNF